TARSLRSQRSHMFGFLSDEVATTPYAGKIIQGAQDAAWDSKKMLLIVNTDRRTDIESAAIEMLLERQVAGIIYATMFHRQVAPPLALSHVPVVLLDCFVEDRSLPSVVPDEVRGGRAATEVLIQKGHRRIGFLNNIDPIPASFGRFVGYKQALADYAIAFDEALVETGESTARGGYDAALVLIHRSAPTALFC